MKTKQKTIAVINLKGGVGRSTVSTNLAGELAKRAHTTLFDCDAIQATSGSWYALREGSNKSEGLSLQSAMNHQELIEKVSKDKSTFLVLDSEPRLKEIARAMIMLSDLVLIPVAASAAEVWATGDVIQLLEEAKKVRKVEARLVWSRHRANTKLAKEVMAEVQKVLGVGFLKTSLGLRVAYQEALGLGLTGAEMSDKVAREEVNQLVKEVLSIVGNK